MLLYIVDVLDMFSHTCSVYGVTFCLFVVVFVFCNDVQIVPGNTVSVLFCSVLFCSVLFCSVLFCSVLFCSVLFYCSTDILAYDDNAILDMYKYTQISL